VAVIFHRLAAKEARAAEAWYSARSIKASDRFRTALEAAANRVAKDPEAHPFIVGQFRQIGVKGFPFVLVYRRINERDLIVVSVAHTSRRPGYWRRRK
jgi:toxin ParE1/3/4